MSCSIYRGSDLLQSLKIDGKKLQNIFCFEYLSYELSDNTLTRFWSANEILDSSEGGVWISVGRDLNDNRCVFTHDSGSIYRNQRGETVSCSSGILTLYHEDGTFAQYSNIKGNAAFSIGYVHVLTFYWLPSDPRY